jgi:diaminopropionate ammonia-lyase
MYRNNLEHERRERLQAVRTFMIGEGIDLAVIHVMEDIFWISGFSTPGAPAGQALIITGDDIMICSRKLEVSNAPETLERSGYEDDVDPIDHLLEHIRLRNPRSVGLQYANRRSSPLEFSQLCSALERSSTMIPIDGQITRMRVPKSSTELSLMRRAAEICTASMKVALEVIGKEGATEKSVVAVATREAYSLGGDYSAYPGFVGAGPNSLNGHYACRDAQKDICRGENIMIELSGCFQRYHVAMMRTAHLGKHLPKELEIAEGCVKSALDRMREVAFAGAVYGDIHRAATECLCPLEKLGWVISQRMCYNIGIGFPTDWGEPEIDPTTVLVEGATFHILPWVRHMDFGAVALSDTVLICKEGAISLFPEYSPEECIQLIPPPDQFLDDVLRVSNVFPEMDRTPLLEFELVGLHPDRLSNTTILVKDESTRLGQKSFKALGGSYALACEIGYRTGRVPGPDLRRKPHEEVITFVTASDGNHGAGVAWAAKKLDHMAVIWFPMGTDEARIDEARDHGATVIVSDLPYDQTVALATIEAEEKGWCLVQDTSWENYTQVPSNIMLAYSLIAHEVSEQCRLAPSHIILQVGVGSFAAAIVKYVRKSPILRHATIITVEAEQTACLKASFESGIKTDVSTPETGTISAGLECCRVSDIAWEVLRDTVDISTTVSDKDVEDGVRLANSFGLESGESGASVGLGLLLRSAKDLGIGPDSRVLIFNTEGITAPSVTSRILSMNAQTGCTNNVDKWKHCLAKLNSSYIS